MVDAFGPDSLNIEGMTPDDYPEDPAEQVVYEREHVLRAQKGDKDARQKLIRIHMGWIASKARWYSRRGVPFFEAVSEGVIGLSTAIDKWSPEEGTRLMTYAAHWIQHALQEGVARMAGGVIRPPANVYRGVKRWKRAERELTAERGGEPPADMEILERARLCKTTMRQVKHALAVHPGKMWPLLSEQSQGTVRGADGRGTENIDLLCALYECASKMPLKHWEIFARHIGLWGSPETGSEIARRYKCTRQAVSLKLIAAVKRVRELLTEGGYECTETDLTGPD